MNKLASGLVVSLTTTLLASGVIACAPRTTPSGPGEPDVTPPSQTVRFHFTGHDVGYLAGGCSGNGCIAGPECGSIAIERLDDGAAVSVAQGVGISCGCECGVPGSLGAPHASRFTPLMDGSGGLVFAWTAASVIASREVRSCPYGASATVVHGSPAALEPGHYRATFPLSGHAASGHASSSDPPEAPHGDCASGSLGDWCDACPSSYTASVEFDLPSSGDLDVDVPVPDDVPAGPTPLLFVGAWLDDAARFVGPDGAPRSENVRVAGTASASGVALALSGPWGSCVLHGNMVASAGLDLARFDGCSGLGAASAGALSNSSASIDATGALHVDATLNDSTLSVAAAPSR